MCSFNATFVLHSWAHNSHWSKLLVFQIFPNGKVFDAMYFFICVFCWLKASPGAPQLLLPLLLLFASFFPSYSITILQLSTSGTRTWGRPTSQAPILALKSDSEPKRGHKGHSQSPTTSTFSISCTSPGQELLPPHATLPKSLNNSQHQLTPGSALFPSRGKYMTLFLFLSISLPPHPTPTTRLNLSSCWFFSIILLFSGWRSHFTQAGVCWWGSRPWRQRLGR